MSAAKYLNHQLVTELAAIFPDYDRSMLLTYLEAKSNHHFKY